MKAIALAILAALLLSSCSGLNGYDRSYTVGYTDPEGRTANVGVTLHPRGYSK